MLQDFVKPATLVEMGVPPMQIHSMTSVSGVTRDEAWAGRTVMRVGSHEIAVIGMRELLRNRRAAGRTKDLADVEALDAAEQ